MKVLGIIINDQLRATDHVNSLLSSCSSLLFALRVLRSRGIPTVSLQDVFRSTVLAKITYYTPAWSGTCTAADRAKLGAFLSRCKRLGYCTRAWRRSLTLLVMLMTHCSRVLTQTVAISFTNICLTGVTVNQYTT